MIRQKLKAPMKVKTTLHLLFFMAIQALEPRYFSSEFKTHLKHIYVNTKMVKKKKEEFFWGFLIPLRIIYVLK